MKKFLSIFTISMMFLSVASCSNDFEQNFKKQPMS